MNVLHVLNYGWPWIDGYTARSIGLLTAQERHLAGVSTAVATSPFMPLAHGRDERFENEAWNPDRQTDATCGRAVDSPGPLPGPLNWERPAVGLAPVTDARFESALKRIARREAADILHAHHPHYVARSALRVAASLRRPAVYELRCFNGNYDLSDGTRYGALRGRWQNSLEFATARSASAVVTISDGLAEQLARAGVDEQRLFVVRNSVDTERFRPDPGGRSWGDRRERWQGRERLSLHVGYATSFERMENLDVAIEATGIARTALLEQGIELTLSIAGTGRDHARIERLVLDRGDTDHVHLPGHLPYSSMPDFYHSLDLFLVPRGDHAVSRDTTPLKPLEALACGLPLLATALPAMRELLQHREDVRFCDTDAASMARGLIDFAEQPWRGTGQIENRAWSHEVQRYDAVYQAAARHGPPQRGSRLAALTGRRLPGSRAESTARS